MTVKELIGYLEEFDNACEVAVCYNDDDIRRDNENVEGVCYIADVVEDNRKVIIMH